MAAHAARRLSDMADNLATILGIELFGGCARHRAARAAYDQPSACGGHCAVARAGVGARVVEIAIWPTIWPRQGNRAGRIRCIAGRCDFGAQERPVSKPCRERLSVINRRLDNDRTIRAPRGSEMSAKRWLTEAPLRMLMNNLDPEVAERPSELVVYGGSAAPPAIGPVSIGSSRRCASSRVTRPWSCNRASRSEFLPPMPMRRAC